MCDLHAVSEGSGPSAQLVIVLVVMQELPDGVVMAVVAVNVGRSDVLIESLDGDAVGEVDAALPPRPVSMLTISLIALDVFASVDVATEEIVLPPRPVRTLIIPLIALDVFASVEVRTEEGTGTEVNVLVAAFEEATELDEAINELVADGAIHTAADAEF